METLECVVGQVDVQAAWDPIYRWFLKWKQSCGTEALSCQVCVNSGQLVSELNRIVGHLVGVIIGKKTQQRITLLFGGQHEGDK